MKKKRCLGKTLRNPAKRTESVKLNGHNFSVVRKFKYLEAIVTDTIEVIEKKLKQASRNMTT